MRISDWSSDVCSSDLPLRRLLGDVGAALQDGRRGDAAFAQQSHEQDEGGEEAGAVEAAQRQRPGLRIVRQSERQQRGAEAGQVALAQAQAAPAYERPSCHPDMARDPKSALEGKILSVLVPLGGSRIIKNKHNKSTNIL